MSNEPRTTSYRLILASASPRREELLRGVGLSFQVIPSEEGEEEDLLEEPRLLAEALAIRKARDVAKRMRGGLVIGADTLVEVERFILGKPKDCEEAREQLRRLSGRVHRVITGVAVVEAESGREEVASEVTLVKMRECSPQEIEAYLLTGEPFDKAGSYAIQGLGAFLVEGIQGDWSNVVGLPLGTLRQLLLRFGLDPLLQGET